MAVGERSVGDSKKIHTSQTMWLTMREPMGRPAAARAAQ